MECTNKYIIYFILLMIIFADCVAWANGSREKQLDLHSVAYDEQH